MKSERDVHILSRMSELAVALIGGGNIAKAHVAAAKESGGRVRIAAVVDPSDVARASIVGETGAVGFQVYDHGLRLHAATSSLCGNGR